MEFAMKFNNKKQVVDIILLHQKDDREKEKSEQWRNIKFGGLGFNMWLNDQKAKLTPFSHKFWC